MKRVLTFLSVAVLFAAPAFAAGNKPQKVVLPQTVQIGATQVPAGTYKLDYTGTGTVQVTLTQNGKTVATFAAKAVEQKNPNPGVNLLNSGSSATLEAIYLNKVSLELTTGPTTATTSAGQ